jgi:hypothetical protein
MRNFELEVVIPGSTYITQSGVPQYTLLFIREMPCAGSKIRVFYALSCHWNYIMKQMHIKQMLNICQELVCIFVFCSPRSPKRTPYETKREWCKMLILNATWRSWMWLLYIYIRNQFNVEGRVRKIAKNVIFYLHNPSSRTLALGSTQPLTEMSTRNSF